jgi:uncharacterized protein (DUF885 family)
MARPIILTALVAVACGSATGEPTPVPAPSREPSFEAVAREYAIGFLQRNPVPATYLGASALDPSLADIDGKLRDHSPAALASEDRWLKGQLSRFEAIEPASLKGAHKIDRAVAMAQIRFLLRQHQHRRLQQRAIDTYIDEPFRGLDWQLQGLTRTGEKTYGTEKEWRQVLRRVQAIPAYLATARQQIEAGVRARNTADHRMLRRNGIEAARAGADYFAKDLVARAKELAGTTLPADVASALPGAGKQAAAAYRGFADFVAGAFFRDPRARAQDIKPEFGGDRYAFGEAEYDWALANNLRIEKRAAALYEESWPIVQETRGQMIALSRQIGRARRLTLPADDEAAVRRIYEALSAEHPRSNEEMIAWYARSAKRLVEYGRKVGLFDIPTDYRLDVTLTPPPLQASSSGAAYYPAPPLKGTGVGRFYVSPATAEEIGTVAAASVADLSAHEGFPGHDWHYKVMTQFGRDISAVRWLTPGAVEDSSSMWQDSMAIEGWGLYAEALVAEPQPGAPSGFYTPEERLYQLQGKLLRDLRVRVDIGIHTGRLTYDQAVDLMSQVIDFLPGSCAAPATPAKRTSCVSAEQAIFRYSKWPTQAITYRLGRDEIVSLRAAAAAAQGASFSPKAFHLELMKQGPIPASHFRRDFLATAAR